MSKTNKNSSNAKMHYTVLEESQYSNFFKLPNDKLQAHLARMEHGNSEIYTSPFFGLSKCENNEEKLRLFKRIVDGWKEILEDSDLSAKWPSLMKFENDLLAKVGPMSIQVPLSERLADIDSYYESILLDSEPVDEEALQAVIDEFSQVRGLRIRDQEHTLRLMKKSTSAGAPFMGKKKDHLDVYPCDVFSNALYSTKAPKNKGFFMVPDVYYEDPAIARSYYATAVVGWRGQEGGPEPKDTKQRVIWMFPFGVNLAELQWYQPFIEACQRFGLVPAWISMTEVDRRITRLFDTKAPEDLVVCTDFSKFDQHFNRDMRTAAYKVMYRLAQRDDEDTDSWFTDGPFDAKYHIPLCIGENTIIVGEHGMGSGSGGTNADETIAHRALQHEAALRSGVALNQHSQCLGDDGVLSYHGITVEDVIRAYSSHGQEMNPEKQYASTQDCVYLRRWHHKDYRVNGVCVGVYSTYRALNRLAMQERFYDEDKWSKEMVALRYLSILENVKYHPLRERFVDYCIKGDKYRLGIDLPGFLDNIEAIAQKATEQMPDFLGYTKTMQPGSATGLSSWWIVQYLKSKA
nr:MAG: RNA-dependent RNA polymerase [Porcine picobirnavirus]